jgi:hypothetical protein
MASRDHVAGPQRAVRLPRPDRACRRCRVWWVVRDAVVPAAVDDSDPGTWSRGRDHLYSAGDALSPIRRTTMGQAPATSGTELDWFRARYSRSRCDRISGPAGRQLGVGAPSPYPWVTGRLSSAVRFGHDQPPHSSYPAGGPRVEAPAPGTAKMQGSAPAANPATLPAQIDATHTPCWDRAVTQG